MKLEVENFDHKIDGGLEFMAEDANSRNVSVIKDVNGNNIVMIYERKINDLQKRLDTQYDIIEEAENAVEEIRSQIRDLRRDQISSESIYEFLLHFDELYSMASEVEKKQFMQTFIDRIDIFPERREDGNWIKNISFKFYVPVTAVGLRCRREIHSATCMHRCNGNCN